jgi:large subunit ribosomal protein L30e
MTIIEDMQSAIKTGKAVIGYKESVRFIKLNIPKLIVVARNMPEKYRKEIEHNAKVSSAKLETFNGSSKELGVICGKPFPVTTVVIK